MEEKNYQLIITNDSFQSTNSTFNINNLSMGDLFKPVNVYFQSKTGEKIQRQYNKNERKNSNQTLPRLTFQIYEKEIERLTKEERLNFPTCQYTPDSDIIKGIFDSIQEIKEHRNSIEFLEYKSNKNYFVIYCWNIFSTLMFVQECLKRFGNEGDQFILKYKEKTQSEILEETYTNFKTQNYLKKLKSSKNLILRGAPGTGKTYLARKIAEELTGGNEDQIGFVQFHPSYDYTDFVEGLRPVSSADGQIGFELQDGIFREFCKKAKKATESGGRNNFDEAWKLFYDEALNVPYKVKYQFESNHKKYYLIALSEDEVDLSEGEGRQSGVVYDENKKDLGFYSKDIVQEVYNEGLIANDRVSEIIIQHLKEKYGLVNYVKPTETTTDKNFVFIIDEINRGEISKIFGELFFSIDPDYRGKDGKVTTQYANLRETDKEFYIPENVYIIGTMNDIDRSVDTFDFAMRRRFRFVEIKAADTMGMWENNDEFDNDKIEEARNRLTNLNKAISDTEGLNSHYHIGPSYFLKLPSVNYDYDLLWSDYLEPLLKDYLRGSYDETDSLDKLKDAYNNEEKTDETH
ncbi:TPA: AAA family ATPase [Streptococcus mutans]|uniref:McrB family protein n=2 Tax=Streptococcus TaxID=1301 RepID=UPI0002B4E7B4|nr:AAA family ATPase [Streptococcus mutans]EMC20760.1 putative endonuclease [Streptococcus mutans SF1]EMC45906.1 putative endonuclease [Streptococcus mutans SM4]MCB5047875.1 AAA family ATPase [Streptococcus mutans]